MSAPNPVQIMKLKIRNLSSGEVFDIPDVSKANLVRKFKLKVEAVTGVPKTSQELYFSGKCMNDSDDLCDYRVENNFVIMMKVKKDLEPMPGTSKQNGDSSMKKGKKRQNPDPNLMMNFIILNLLPHRTRADFVQGRRGEKIA